jgi:signal transduction histidine kinase/CheY-like chemotaxis protein
MISFELVEIFQRLQWPETRASGAMALASHASSGSVLIFSKDHEAGVFLPAFGFPQTLRQGLKWQTFLQKCAGMGMHADSTPKLDKDEMTAALGIADNSSACVVVFLDTEKIDPSLQKSISALLPLLGAKLETERAALIAESRANAAREASQRAGALNAALDASRRELQEVHARVEQELMSRREAERKLREADQRKDEFLAMLAHELRNPLAPISAAAELMELVHLGEAQLKETSQIITRQIRHMTGLVDDLLDVSRVTRGLVSISKVPQDLKQILPNAVEQIRPLIEAKNHHLTIEMPPEPALVLGDTKRLVQILANLLNNAAKYTPDGGRIRLQMEVCDEHVMLVVEDNGIGIAPETQTRVFELFAQAERSSDRSQGGLGLGLALVASIVGLHGGTVACFSDGLGKGSRFTVQLPRLFQAQPCPSSEPGRRDAQASDEKLCILIVDDNADAASMLAMLLETFGHDVVVEHRAKSALDRMRSMHPDVCVLDIGLPEMDGNELARRIRAQPGKVNTTLIAVTGYGQEHERTSTAEAGFDHHLVKPVDASRLRSLLNEITERKRA